MRRVCVLLSTYNGERFLRKQLDSLIAQKGVEVVIYARDDGSKDSSPEILQEYENAGHIARILPNDEGNLGFADSFYRLVEGADEACDYFAFCDQDDLWDEDKLLSAANILDGTDENKPSLVFGTYRVINENDKVIRKVGMKHYRHRPEYAFEDLFSKNYTYGCTCVFNRKARDKYLKYNLGEIRFHDWTINVICAALGTVNYDSTPHMGYRLHNANSFGPASLRRQAIKKFIKYCKEYEFNNTRLIEMQRFCSHFYDELKGDKKEFADLVLNYKDGGKKALLKYKRFWKKSLSLRLVNRYQIRTGKF